MNRELTWIFLAAGVVLATNCRQTASGHEPGPTPSATAPTPVPSSGRVAITVDEQGYHPPSVSVAAGQPVTLVFTRTTDQTCGTQVVFPAQHIQRDLPLNQPVEVALNAPPSGALEFTCGMNMFRGSVVVR